MAHLSSESTKQVSGPREKRSFSPRMLALPLLMSLWAVSLGVHAQVNSPADFTVHPQVLAPAPPRIGFNLSQGAGSADITDNVWLFDGGFSSYDVRMDYVATDDGAGDGSTFISTDTGRYGTDYYNSLNSNGAFDGAQARVYRFNTTTNAWTLIRTGIVQGMTAVSGSTATADHTITFTTPGAQSLAGDSIWLSRDAVYQSPDITQWLTELPSRFTYYVTSWGIGAGSSYTHVTDVPPGQTNGQSTAPPLSIQMTTTLSTGTVGISQYIQGLGGTGNEQFESGHSYTLSVWLKQTGISDSSATFTIGKTFSHTFTGLTGTWQQFTYTFASPGAYASIPVAQLAYNAPGTLWVNQLQLFDASHGAFTLDSRVLSSFQNFNPGSMRIWSGFSNTSHTYTFWSLDSWLQDESASRGTPNIGTQGYLTSQQDKLPVSLALAKQLGSNAWLICNMSWSEREWSNFIDYLAAPSGIGYATHRPASHPGPYTADFNKIYLEFGNEEWGTQYTAMNGAYGQYAHYMFSQAVAGKSYYDPTKIKLVLNNFTQNANFGNTAIANCPEGQALDYYMYTGSSNTGDAGYQDDLLSIEAYQSDINLWTSNERASAAAGHPYEVTSYEGGSGSDDPNNTTQGDVSLAAATGQLDIYLYGQQQGMTALNFFGYGLGTKVFTSHTNFAGGFIPHPIWEALTMRNQYCAGDIVLTDNNTCPATTDGTNTPLVGVYTFHDTTGGTNKADVVVISRDLNNATPVTFHLPTASTAAVTLYTLTGDPRTNNDSSLLIPIGTQSIPSFGKSYSFSMPAGSIYIFQVPTAAWPAQGPTNLAAGSGTNSVQLSWSAYSGATSYNIYRGTSPAGLGTTPYATGIISPSYVDTGVTYGTAYYYRVTAITAAGETDTSSLASVIPIAPAPFIAINCGGAAIASTKWVADTDNNGLVYTQSNVAQTVPPTLINPAPAAVYQTLRVQGLYTISGVTPGAAYTVRIHGQESWDNPGVRLEDVMINGQTVESALEWLAVAGGKNIAAARTYSIIQGPSTSMTVQVVAHANTIDPHAEMSGIEISAGSVPLQPTNLIVTPGSGTAALTWNPAGGASSYTVLYGTTSGTYTMAQNVTGTSTTITGLTPATIYYFVVVGVNAQGPSPYSVETNTGLPVAVCTDDLSSQSDWSGGVPTPVGVLDTLSTWDNWAARFTFTPNTSFTTATLWVYRDAADTVPINLYINQASTDAWTETAGPQPAPTTLIATQSVPTGGVWVSTDVTSYVRSKTSSGVVTFDLYTSTGSWITNLHTRHNTSNPPKIVFQ